MVSSAVNSQPVLIHLIDEHGIPPILFLIDLSSLFLVLQAVFGMKTIDLFLSLMQTV